jgi:hypothetical protein
LYESPFVGCGVGLRPESIISEEKQQSDLNMQPGFKYAEYTVTSSL